MERTNTIKILEFAEKLISLNEDILGEIELINTAIFSADEKNQLYELMIEAINSCSNEKEKDYLKWVFSKVKIEGIEKICLCMDLPFYDKSKISEAIAKAIFEIGDMSSFSLSPSIKSFIISSLSKAAISSKSPDNIREVIEFVRISSL